VRGWPAEIIEKARALAAEGLSAARIAALCSTPERTMTRNAVIGLAHRGNFKLRQNAPGKHTGYRRVAADMSAVPKTPYHNMVNVSAIAAGKARIDPPKLARPKHEPAPIGEPDTLGPGCKWIQGETNAPGWRQCGHERADGSAYCPHHHQRAYTGRSTFTRTKNAGNDANREAERALLKAMRS
jgi:hypothetical protein